MLPSKLPCPLCAATVELSEPERSQKTFVCPSCGQEVDLRDNYDFDKLVTVFTPANEADRLLAMSALEGAGISAHSAAAVVQDLVGFGRLGTGFNPVTGPVKIQVLESDAERAREVLAEAMDD